jgi:hypothetical protein
MAAGRERLAYRADACARIPVVACGHVHLQETPRAPDQRREDTLTSGRCLEANRLSASLRPSSSAIKFTATGNHSESKRGRGFYFARSAYPAVLAISPAAHSG